MSSVHGANIKAGFARQASRHQIIEFVFGFGAEQNIVMCKIRSDRRGRKAEHACRKATLCFGRLRRNMRRALSQSARCQRSWVTCVYQNITFQNCAVRKVHRGCLVCLHIDMFGMNARHDFNILCLEDLLQRLCEPMHAPLDCPDTARFGLPDQR